MAGRAPQSFKKRQKEQQRNEKQQGKLANAESDNKARPAGARSGGEDGEAVRADQTLFENVSST